MVLRSISKTVWVLCMGFIVLTAVQIHAKDLMGQVYPGIDVLVEKDFDILQGKNVGLITNHTALSRDGISDIDILFKGKGFVLKALFCPEHGIRGTEDDENLTSGIDEKTGLPIRSLYGSARRPTPEMLEDIDVLIFDIQDVGARFYTFIGTMAYAMEAAKENNVEFVVLDRPNPINGKNVGGAILPENLTGGLTAIYPIPTMHGMTIGELALFFNEQFEIGCKLEVVPMKNWKRWMYFDDTGLLWRNPSPNMRTLNGAILYPGLGIGETTTLSCGRGTDTPFEMYGTPFFDSQKVAANLKNRNTPGVRFLPISFTPTARYHQFEGQLCHGVYAVIYDREKLDCITAGLHMIQAFQECYPKQYTEYNGSEGFIIMTGDENTWKMLTENKLTPEKIVAKWNSELKNFKKIRKKYLLY